MTWRRVGVIYLVLAALAGAWALFTPAAPSSDPSFGPPTAAESLLGVEEDAVTALTLRQGGVTVRAERTGARWRVTEPAGAEVPPDLVAATVGTLTAGQASQVMVDAREVDLRAFGLDAPSGEIELTLGDGGRHVRLLLGGWNPTKTALYAKRADAPAIYLVGLNLRYYSDLIVEKAGAAGG